MSEKEIRTLLTRATADRPPGIQLLPARMPSRRPARILIPAIATLAVAAVVSAIALILPAQTSAYAHVMAAVETTSQESYRFHGTSGGTRNFEGAFDPARRMGVITRVEDGGETRFVGDVAYTKQSADAKWMAEEYTPPGTDNVNMFDAPAVILVKTAPLDPQVALQNLRSATNVEESAPATGDGWTGTRFTFALNGEKSDPPVSASGTVDVDDQGRVRRLEVTFDDGNTNTMTFTDFGTAVTVEAPPADQIGKPEGPKGPGKPVEKTDPAGDRPADRKAEGAEKGAVESEGTAAEKQFKEQKLKEEPAAKQS
ncbi:hypothetical protein [Acrocarpospora catenulata]|uniref:hypothetical protein n=1 Tax=Acrocarpospora catenulata TaxID=2836182 RepID=UPI001BD9772E|nr:hypothetical protein [Acrocarpospora catenulata]